MSRGILLRGEPKLRQASIKQHRPVLHHTCAPKCRDLKQTGIGKSQNHTGPQNVSEAGSG